MCLFHLTCNVSLQVLVALQNCLASYDDLERILDAPWFVIEVIFSVVIKCYSSYV